MGAVKNPTLWQRLLAFDFPLSRPPWRLAERAASKIGLGRERAGRVIAEYRCFLYLAATADEPVAPSPMIDKVWQLHLEDRAAYVDELSRDVIGCLIDRDPRGPPPVRDPAYQRTLALYREEFREVPFKAIWPDQTLLKRQRRAIAEVIGAWPFLFLASVVDDHNEPVAVLVALPGFVLSFKGLIWLAFAGPWPTAPHGE